MVKVVSALVYAYFWGCTDCGAGGCCFTEAQANAAARTHDCPEAYRHMRKRR